MSIIRGARTFALPITLAVALGCGGSSGYGGNPTGPGTTGGGGGTTGSTSNAISVADNSFAPSATTVAPNTTVTWTWTGANPHNVTFDDGTKSATQASGTYQRTFATAGSYPYHCTIHGAAMSGTITVK